MKLGQTNQELEALSMDFLKKTANHFREFFLRSLGSVIQGTIQASPAQYGETLETEQLRGGSFLDSKDIPAERWERIMDDEVGNAHHRLFGGAQYHRALREFTLAVRMMKTPVITEDEIANAAGVGDMHDGVNFMRAACVIAVEKVGGAWQGMGEDEPRPVSRGFSLRHIIVCHLIGFLTRLFSPLSPPPSFLPRIC